MPTQARFPGFSRDLVRFMDELSRNNSKRWFEAHRSDYDEFYLEPAKAFCEAMAGALSRVGKEVRSEPRVNGSIMRINRDVRFSKDKTPYKTGLHFIFPAGPGPMKASPAYYMRIAPEGLGLAAGLFGFDPKQLAAWRAAVVDAKQGKALRTAVEKVRKAGPYDLPEPEYKRVPRGLDAEHRNAEYLRYKGFHVKTDLPHPTALFSEKAVPFVVDRFVDMRPVVTWLAKALSA